MSIIDRYVDVLQNPKETLAEEKKNATFGAGAIALLTASGIAGIMVMLVTALLGSYFGGYGFLNGMLIGIVLFIGIVIFVLIGALFTNVLNLVAAKILGGKGTFAEQFYLFSLAYAPFVVIMGLFVAAFYIPYLNLLAAFIYLILGIISIYYQVLSIAEAHQVSTARALAIYLLPTLLLGILAAILVLPMVMWYTGVFNPSKFQGSSSSGYVANQCGGFGMFTCGIDQAVTPTSSKFVLGSAVGRSITLKSVAIKGLGAPTGCSIDNSLGPGGDSVSPTGMIYIECPGPSLKTGDPYDWMFEVSYVDSQSGLQKTDTGGFFMGKVG